MNLNTGLRWEAVTVDYPRRDLRAVHNFSLRIPAGRVCALMGPSGCGKTTVLKTAAGLIRPGRGAVYRGNQMVTGPSRRVAMVFQEAALFPWFTVARNIALALSRSPAAGVPGDRVRRLLDMVGLGGFGHALPRELSGGMARRAALAAALARDPAVLLLDEPFSGLDLVSRRRLARTLAALIREHGLTTVLVTHNVDEALMLTDRIAIMTGRPGRVRQTLDLGPAQPGAGNRAAPENMRQEIYRLLETEG